MKTYFKRILDSVTLLLILIVIGTVLVLLNFFSFNQKVLELSRKIYWSLAEAFKKTVWTVIDLKSIAAMYNQIFDCSLNVWSWKI